MWSLSSKAAIGSALACADAGPVTNAKARSIVLRSRVASSDIPHRVGGLGSLAVAAQHSRRHFWYVFMASRNIMPVTTSKVGETIFVIEHLKCIECQREWDWERPPGRRGAGPHICSDKCRKNRLRRFRPIRPKAAELAALAAATSAKPKPQVRLQPGQWPWSTRCWSRNRKHIRLSQENPA